MNPDYKHVQWYINVFRLMNLQVYYVAIFDNMKKEGKGLKYPSVI